MTAATPRAASFAPLAPELVERWSSYGQWDEPYFPRLVGLVVEELRTDYCRMRLPWRLEITQPAGVAHGGAIATLDRLGRRARHRLALRRAPRLRHHRHARAVPRRARRRGRGGRGLGDAARARRSCSARPRSSGGTTGRRIARGALAYKVSQPRCRTVEVQGSAAPASLRSRPVPTTRTLSEAESKRLLAAHGVPVAGERIVATAAEAAVAAAELGLPGRGQAVRRRHRPQDRAGPRAPRPGRRPTRSRRPAAELLAAATPDDGEVAPARGADGAGQPGADRRPQPRPAVRHDRDARRRRGPRRGPRRRGVPARADHPGRRRRDDRRPRRPRRCSAPFRGEPAVDRERARRRARRPVGGGRGRPVDRVGRPQPADRRRRRARSPSTRSSRWTGAPA